MRRAAFALVWTVACGGAPAVAPRAPSAPVPSAPRPGGAAAPSASAPAPAATVPGPPSAPPPACPTDMVDVGAVCIDRYEAPNVEGAVPFALKTAYDGEAWCADRGKRLCTEQEWSRACAGPEGTKYPYGEEHRDGVCNDDRSWRTVHWELLARWPADAAVEEARRLFQGEASGSRPGCVSAEGVHDLTGNVAEWVRRSDEPPHPGYDHVLKGCYWAGCYHEPHPNCVFRNSAHPGTFRTYEAGFRCCRDRS